MSFRPVTVVETWESRRAAGAIMSGPEIDRLIEYLAYHPMAGDILERAGGIRKLRWRLQGRGKRGGARAIFYFQEALSGAGDHHPCEECEGGSDGGKSGPA